VVHPAGAQLRENRRYRGLDWEEIKRLLPELNLPKDVWRLWEDYFDRGKKAKARE